jgi:hypothetical protein
MKKLKLPLISLGVVFASIRLSWAITGPLPDWLQRVHIGGYGAMRTQIGQERAQLERDGGLMVYQGGLIFDVDVARDVSFWYDIDIIREGIVHSSTEYPLQEIYLRWDNLFKQEWLNAKIGRTFTPFGEEYQRWQAIDNPFASWSTALTWGQDEGILLFGDILPNAKLSYAAAVQNGNENFNFSGPHNTAAGRITAKPASWLSASISYINVGPKDMGVNRGGPEFWISGFHITPLGATSADSGASPSTSVDAQGAEGDITITPGNMGSLWLRYGYFYIKDGGGATFSRNIRYYSGEAVGYIPKTDKKLYLAARYSIIGTFSPTLGYQFSGLEAVDPGGGLNPSPYAAFNFDQRDLSRWSFGGGYHYSENVVLKVEYSIETAHLIEPAKTPNNLALLNAGHNFFIGEVDFRF